MVDFLIVGPGSATSYSELFSLFQKRKMILGGKMTGFSVFCRWFQNIKDVSPAPLQLCEFQEDRYKKFDHFDAINVDKISEIPDYDGVMGVPLSFFDYWNPGQFEIVDACDYRDDVLFSNRSCRLLNCNGGEAAAVEGKKKFARILIKKK